MWFRGCHRLSGGGRFHRRHSPLHRDDKGRGEIHVGGTCRGDEQACRRGQVGTRSGRSPRGVVTYRRNGGSDDVVDAALRRAGILRVETIPELFDTVGTLGLAKQVGGDRLAIITNGGGPGVMAMDALVLRGGRPATLGNGTLAELDKVLPRHWSRANPVDIVGDAPPQRYVDALRVLLECPDCDAVLFIQAPSAIVGSSEIARAMAPAIQSSPRTVLSCFLGQDAVAEARRIFLEAGIPTYAAPEDAVDAFLQLTRYRESQEIRIQTPASLPEEFVPELSSVRRLVDAAIREGRYHLGEADAKTILGAFGIPVVRTRVAKSPEEAMVMAREIGFPVALKILSPDLVHKSDSGVVLDLRRRQLWRSP